MSRARKGVRPRRRAGAIFSALAILAVAGAVYAHGHLSHRPLWTVRAVEIEGNRSIGAAELLERLALYPGMPWWRISPGAIARLEREEPRLQDVRLSYRPPRDLAVSVRERESRMRVLGPPPLEVAGDGILLEPLDGLDPADLPLLTGIPSGLSQGRSPALPADEFEEILEIAAWSPSLWSAISEVHYAGGRRFEIYLRDARRVILWESGINRDLKREIPSILAELREDRVEDAVLDLRFRDQIVVRLPEGTMADSTKAATSRNGRDASRGGRSNRGRAA